MKRVSISLLAAAVATATLSLVPSASADEVNSVTTAETIEALAGIPGVLDSSNDVTAGSDARSAATSTVNGTTVDVPKDASNGVTLVTAEGSRLTITPPNADASGVGTQVAAGTVAYPATGGAANAVQATEGGGVRMLTVIDNVDAPTSYAYEVGIPSGGRVEPLPEGGGAAVIDSSDNVVAIVQAPWARDAHGTEIPTYFTTDGSVLTQHIAHRSARYAYPVTADPLILGVWVSWWALTRIAACVGGGVWGWISGGGNRADQRMYQAFLGCAAALGLRYLFP